MLIICDKDNNIFNSNIISRFICAALKFSTQAVAKLPVNRYNVRSKNIIILVAEYEPLRHFYTVCIKWECAGNGKTFKYCIKSKEDPLYQKVH